MNYQFYFFLFSRRHCLLFLLFLWSTFSVCANTVEINVTKQLTYKEGLSHFGVTSLELDKNGLLWVGTFKGLNIYDGYEFKSHYFQDTPALLSNRITSLHKDKHDNILIGTEKGLSIYRERLDRFDSLFMTESIIRKNEVASITDIVETKKYIVCNTSKGWLIILDKDDYSIIDKQFPLPQYNNNFKAFHISEFVNNQLLIASNRGLLVYDIDRKTFRNNSYEHFNYCVDVAFDGHKTVYALSYTDVFIYQYDSATNRLNYVTTMLKDEYFSQLKIGLNGELWLLKNNNTIALITEPNYYKNIKQNIVYYHFMNDFTRLSSITLSKFGGWAGSFNQGVFQIKTEKPFFQYTGLKEKYKENKSSQVINIVPYSTDKVYVTLNVNDNKLFDLSDLSIKNIKHPKVNNQLISKVLVGRNKSIWGGSRRKGIFRKKDINANWEQLKIKNNPDFLEEGAQTIIEDGNGDIWLAGLNALYKFCLDDNGEIKKVDQLNQLDNLEYDANVGINVMYYDEVENCIWIGTNGNGLYKVVLNENHTLSQQDCKKIKMSDSCPLEGSIITCIKRLPNKELWVGVLEGGISKMEKNGDAYCFETFTEKDGLDDNDVMTFEFDVFNRLWIATNKGINQFDPATKTFVNYTTSDGIVPASFEVVSTKLQNGLMVFGGNNGLCYFDPNQISSKIDNPTLLFGELKIHNKKIDVEDKEGAVLTKVLNETSEITLENDQNSLSFELISLHYENANTYGLRYRLLPREKNWNTSTSNNKIASYNLLPAGEYTFEVQASNSKNEWTESRTIKINILEAWWKTFWAKLFYLFLFLVVIIIVMTVIIRIKSLSYKLKLEHLEKNKLKDLDAARLKLFMNISHEFRTPLTLINGPITLLKNMFENNQDAFEHIDLVQRQSKKMLQLVDQVHEIRKADQNLLKLKKKHFDFTHLITDVKKDFDQLAEKSNKILKLVGTDHQLMVDADESKLEIVINNLLNNAFKFTGEKDEITITYDYKGESLIFSVEDTGRGISEENQKNIFKRFYQSDNKDIYTAGSGIGLELSKMIIDLHGGTVAVESEMGKGTKFTIELPVDVKVKEELSDIKVEESIKEESHDQRQRTLTEMVDISFLTKDSNSKNSLIYYVEDNVDLRNFVSNILSQHYKVKTFDHGKACVDALEKEWPDLILSDILMPVMNGLELCEIVKGNVKTSHLPIVLLTSKSSSDEKIEGMNVGADAYLTKPFEIKQVVATIENILKSRKVLQDRFQMEVPLPIEKKALSDSDKKFLEDFTNLLNENLSNENIDLQEFSKELYMSRSQFFRKIKSITNSTPNDIIRTFKLKKAAELLLIKENTVNDVVIMTGFKNRTHFSKLFKDHFGVSPGKYASETNEKINKNSPS
ncbi:hybrid sensor histidine kinase/response regulator transcription factor [Flammeovirga aprica]|uniref:histidine kinase n=1 Tax=Flammeovirga aprica JL-4 TaxID=694437 RepID=A0A7X9P2K5_9BACT|nr:ATP-binding protein [Flammeovirga aprica]NME67822.1 response regulator [Flammeovirga aprica JL-4]